MSAMHFVFTSPSVSVGTLLWNSMKFFINPLSHATSRSVIIWMVHTRAAIYMINLYFCMHFTFSFGFVLGVS